MNFINYFCSCFVKTNKPPSIEDFDAAILFIPPIKSRGTVIKVYDGDTITVVTKLQLKGSPYYKFNIRLAGVDTPEMRGPNKSAAIAARDALAGKVLNREIIIKNVKTEKYGRLLADIYVNEQHINQWLIDEGYAVPYFGGKKN
jgi:micrococcal nuclease